MRRVYSGLCVLIAGLVLAACGGAQPDEAAVTITPTMPDIMATSTPRSTSTPLPTSEPVESATTPALTEAPTATPQPTPDPAANYNEAELSTIAAINVWRISEGLWPLQINDTLSEMARAQADYVLSLPSIPYGAAIHYGPDGKHERQRALIFGWPHYSTEEQVAVGEVAYAGGSMDAALGFWNGSDIHHRTIINDTFREIGAAVVPYSGGDLYIVVVGGRPGVLPALLDGDSGTLYLTSERYRWAASGDWMQAVTQVQLSDGPDTVSDDNWLPWQVNVPAPEEANRPLFVALSDGLRQLIERVTVGSQALWFPSSGEQSADAGDTEETETPQPSPTAAPTSAPQAATEEPASMPAGGADVLILYDGSSLSVINISGEAANIASLEMVADSGVFPVTRWESQWLAAPLSAFPSPDCLQVWALGEGDPGQPTDCRYRRSVIYIPPVDRFWLDGPFEVQQNGDVLASCGAGLGFCEVALP